ncbi:MAG: class I SAM-dependent methyltransferase, partial [Candidatus Kerfeldbacteria bacterium]|nr:class I SAM-dependent methyltransferase [Candidatus Kerfeldbacteria bacterium]
MSGLAPHAEEERIRHVTTCPLCGGERIKHFFTIPPGRGQVKEQYSLFRCNDCCLGFTSPRPAEEELVRLYDEAFYGSYRVSKQTMDIIDALFFRGRRRQIELHKKPGRLLDVGCGSGRFVRYMAKHGWDTVGYDFSPRAYELADEQRNGRVHIIDGKLSDHELPEQSFDVVTLWQVFEHIAEPLGLLAELRRLLKPGGLLVIAVPNIDSFQAALTGKRWWGLDIPRHLSHYAPQSL